MEIEIHYNEEGETLQKILEEFVVDIYRNSEK